MTDNNKNTDEALLELLRNEAAEVSDIAPPPSVWSKLRHSLVNRNKKRRFYLASIAASIFAIVIFSGLVSQIRQEQRIEQLIVENQLLESQMKDQIILVSSNNALRQLKEIEFQLWSSSTLDKREQLLTARKKQIERILLIQKGDLHEYSI